VDDDRVGAIAARKNAFFQARPVSHLDAVIPPASGNEQSGAVYSILDGSAFLLTLDQKAQPWASTLARDERAQ
jgi:hypothetical protein